MPNARCSFVLLCMTAIYCFVGVPLFAMVLGSAASFQVDNLMEMRVRGKIEKNIEVTEFEFANSLAGGKHSNDKIEYVWRVPIGLAVNILRVEVVVLVAVGFGVGFGFGFGYCQIPVQTFEMQMQMQMFNYKCTCKCSFSL